MSLENKQNKQSKLFKKILGGFGQLSRRWKSTSHIFSKFNVSTDNLKDENQNNSNKFVPTKSFDNLDFIRYIDQISNNQTITSNNIDSKWEVLSQIQHTPRQPNYTKNLVAGMRHKSMSDLSNCSKVGSIRCRKRRNEKINDVLDFLLQQMFNTKTNSTENIKESIDNLIFESCVEKLLFMIDDYAETFRQRPIIKSSDYLSIVCSPTNSCSDNEPTIKPNKKPKMKPGNNLLSQNSSIICSIENSNKQFSKRSKIGLNIQNTHPLTPVRERSAYRYKAKRKPIRKKSKSKSLNDKQKEVNNHSNLNQVETKIKSEYHSYVSAKKDRILTKCHKETQNSDDKTLLSKSQNNEVNSKDNKLSKTADLKSDKNIKNNTTSDKIKKLSIIKASSVDFLASNNETMKTITNSNNQSLNFQNVSMISLRNKDFKMTPINVTYIGNDNQFNSNNNKIEQNLKTNYRINYKSVCTNLKLNDTCESTVHKTLSNYKSTSCFGRSSLDNYSQKCSLLNYTNSNVDYRNDYTIENSDQTIDINKLLLTKTDINNDNQTSTYISHNIEKLDNSESEQSSQTFRQVKAKLLHNSFPSNCSVGEINSQEMKSNTNFEISQSINIDPNPEEIQAIYEKVLKINGFNNDELSCNRTFSYNDINKNHKLQDKHKISSIMTSQTGFSKFNTFSDDNDEVEVDDSDSDSNDQECELKSMADEFTQYPSMGENSEVDYFIKGGLQKQFQLSSMVTISPNVNYPIDTLINYDINNDTYPTFTFTGRSKTHSRKKSKTYSIPENLLKHTFASQQKIRLKRDM